MKKTEQQIEELICQDYLTGKYSSRELGIKYSKSKSTVLRILQRNNIQPINKRLVNNNLDINYFENIDCEEKAYLLGFIFSDGCVSNDELYIDINDKDREILEFFKEQVHSNCLIKTRIKGKSIMSRIAIKNKQFTQHLAKYGIIPNKTYETHNLPIDLIPQEYKKDFLRGLIDGDGWVIKTSENVYKIGYVTKYQTIAEDFITILNSLIETPWTRKISLRNDGKYAMVQLQAQNQVRQTANVLYRNNKISLSRKFKMAQEIYDSKC